MVLRVHCSDEGCPDILLSGRTEPQPTLLSGGVTRDSRNMLSPLECIWLQDTPLSFSSPCQPGYLKDSVKPEMDTHLPFRVAYIWFEVPHGTQQCNRCRPVNTGDTVYMKHMFVYLHAFMCALVYIFSVVTSLQGEQWHSIQVCAISGQSVRQHWTVSPCILPYIDWMGTAEEQWVPPDYSSVIWAD